MGAIDEGQFEKVCRYAANGRQCPYIYMDRKTGMPSCGKSVPETKKHLEQQNSMQNLFARCADVSCKGV